jgi:sulfite reductase (NADPH) flavoprotein alpha-component
LGASGAERVNAPDGVAKSLREALRRDYQITQPSRQFVEVLAQRLGERAGELPALLDPERRHDLEAHLWGRECIDLLLEHPGAGFTPEEFVGALRKMPPRLYSIASSRQAHPGEVHLIVAVVRYESHGRPRKGVASTFLADRVTDDTRVPVFVHSAKGFRLPEDPGTPILMVGPGTGIAPFRAFLEEREVTGARGRNWLFFGEQRKETEFFYREEFEKWQADGLLTRLDTAFSRDQADKIYVQHRLLENAAEVWRWIDRDGAHLYVCGDARRMAKDVEAALHTMAREQGGRTPEQATEYIENLRKAKRYKRDVY